MDMQEQQKRSPITLFYSYANEDEKLCEELEKHLSILQRQAVIAGWDHHKILPGTDKNQINDEQFSSAQIILLLISPDFLASDTSHTEMEQAVQRHTAGLSSVIPLLLRPVDWQPAAFAHLQALPRNGTPVTKWENRDEAFADIAKDVRLAIEQWNSPSFKLPRPSPTPALPSPFLCSARKDLPLLKRLKEALQASGMMNEKEHQALQRSSPDEEEKEDLHQAIRNASAVILIATPATRRSRSVKHALQIAEMYQRPLYLFWVQGNHLVEVMPTGWSHLPSIDARGERYSQALQDLVQALGRQTSSVPSHISSIKHPTIPLDTPRNPYKGLQAFRVEDAQDFFGRDRLTEEVLANIQQLLTVDHQDHVTSRLLTILGPSGSGKSSVVMAGLLPKLKQGRLTGSEHWTYLAPMVPGKHPLEALSLILTPLFPERSLKSIREDIDDDSARGLHLLLTMHVQQSGMRVLLVIDQFEELFTQTATESERQQFLDIVLAATSEPYGPLISVLTLRADFYDRPLQYPELGRLIKSHQVIIFPMEMPDLRKVIEQPAQLPDVQLTFEEGLVGDLLFDVQGQAGTLPLLQFTLDQLFQHREGQLLTLHAYHQIGGVKGALAQHAESTYQSLPTEKQQRLARALFLRLINPGTVEGDATRRRIPRSELIVINQEETARLAEVTNAFTKARLLTTNTVGGVSTVEVSHEALILAWFRLQDWLHEAREDIHIQQAISEDTTDWNQHKHPTDRLYRGSQLIEALRWRATNLPSLDEDRFLQASVKERLRFRRRTFLIGLIGVAGIAGTGFLATTLLGSEAKSPPQPISPYTYKGHTNAIRSVAWSPDGTRIASASDDTTVQVWDVHNGKRQLTYTGHISSVWSIAWSPDGTRIASASDDTTVQVWDAYNGKRQLIYANHTNSVLSVAWSPDSTRIASASDDMTVQICDVSSGSRQLTYTGHSGSVLSVAWSPDGTRIASASADTTIQVWDAHNSNRQLTYTSHSGSVLSVAWSPDGKYIASASADTTVQICDVSSGSRQLTYTGHSGFVRCVAWSPDGKYIASASDDTTVQICDASNGNQQFIYTGHNGTVWSVTWSPDSKHIASASDDTTVQVCDAKSSGLQFIYTGHTNVVLSVAWSPDGKHIASASEDMTAQIWDANSGSRQFTYTNHENIVESVAWSPDGKHIASASDDKTVQVWDTNSGNLQFTYTNHTDSVNSVAWSPNGRRIASASTDNTVQVWDANNGKRQLIYTGHTNAVRSVTWSPDGKYIASASDFTTVQVWDTSDGNQHLNYMGHTNAVTCVAWSPDGKHIASASYDTTVQIWNANNGSLQLTYMSHTNAVTSVAWSPNGKHITSASADKTVQVWDANSGSLQFTYSHPDAVLSVAWSPNGKHIISGSWDSIVRIWNASEE